MVEVDCGSCTKGQAAKSCDFFVGKKCGRSWIQQAKCLVLGCFHPTVGIARDKDKDDERQDDILMSLSLETRALLFADSLCSSVGEEEWH